MRFVEAGLFWRTALRLLGAAAITMPWRSIYMMPDYFDNAIVRRHEMIHIEQIEREGAFRFCVKYVWWTLRYGYRANPYEIEAYARENDGAG